MIHKVQKLIELFAMYFNGNAMLKTMDLFNILTQQLPEVT